MRIAELAARQHGVVSRRQLIAMGATEKAIRHRLEVARLHRIHTGVYAVGHKLLTGHGRRMAAVLAAGPGAALSHRSGAVHLGLRPSGPGSIEVTSPRKGLRRPGITIHASRSLDPSAIVVHHGVPCTTVARTLVDLSAVVTPRVLDRALEQATILRLFDGAEMDAALAAANGRRGTSTLRRPLAKSRMIRRTYAESWSAAF